MRNADNRETLLQTALELFAARSYDAVGVQEVVSRAGVSKPTLYHYFGSKAGLLEALLKAEFAPWLRTLRTAGEYGGDLVKALESLTSSWIQLALARPDFFHLQLALEFLPTSHETRRLIAPWLAQQQALLEDLLIAAVPQHGNLKGHHRMLALTLLGLLYQVTRALLAGEIEPQPDLVHKLVKQFMYGMYVL